MSGTASPPAKRSAFRMWRKQMMRRVLKSRAATEIGGSLALAYLRLVHATNPLVEGSDDIDAVIEGRAPLIAAYWHGQHIFAPLLRPAGLPMVALLSRNPDAELNAALLRKAGVGAVRGSGGRDDMQRVERGGAKALIQLKRALDDGTSVNMIADISKANPREAGLGIVTLAKISGRPILPIAFATSRRKVIEKSWDKTTVSLPFGRGAVVLGDWVEVARDTDDKGLAEAALRLTRNLNAATRKAYDLVDGTAAKAGTDTP